MKLKTKLLFLAAVIILALPLVLTGNASAFYAPDGSKQNGTTGGWDITDKGVCVTGILSDGTIVTNAATSRPDCIATVLPNDASLTTSAACLTDSDANGGSHYWTSTCVANDGTRISLKDLDRTATNCNKRAIAMGKTSGTMTSKCTGAWTYIGPAGDGAPGFCYTSVNLTTVYPSSATCPVTQIGYSWTSSQCRQSYGVAGYVTGAITKKNGTAGPTAGTFVDLTGTAYDTQGECINEGFSWSTGTAKGGTASVATTPLASTIATNFSLAGRAGCLECHSTMSQYNSYAERWKNTYLMTGHKNMLRKVTPGMNWAGPDGAVYTAAATGTIDFAAATAKISGVDKPLLYLFGDWMAPAPAGLDVIVNMSGAAKYNGTSNYSCAPCHTTGWSNITAAGGLCSLSSKTTSSACTTAGGTWYPSTGVQGTVGAEPLASFPAVTFTGAGEWERNGILCSRCHGTTAPAVYEPSYTTQAACEAAANVWSTSGVPGVTMCASTGGHNNAQVINGQNVTNLCFGCHQAIAKTANGTGLDADLGNPAASIPVKNTATAPAYVPEFSGHVLGNSFLNSPHAKFTGSITPNKLGKYNLLTNDKTQYASTFNGMICRTGTTVGSGSILKTYVDPSTGAAEIIKTSADCTTAGGNWLASGGSALTTQGSCTTCHDVHQSVVPEVGAEEPFVRECTTCHNKSLTSMKHPTTTATPAGIAIAEGDEAVACEICHMPKATSSGFPMHLFRINPSESYSTFPTSAEFLGNTKKIANTAADGTYTNAIWVDVDYACGQCHGGSFGKNATQNGAPYMTKSYLSMVATGMHQYAAENTAPTANYTKLITGLTVTLTDTSTDSGVAFPAMTSSYTPVFVKWGDGSSDKINAGTPISHPYATAGKFMIKYTVQDAGGLFGYKNEEVTVSPSETITVTLSSGLTGSNAKIVLKKKGPYGWVTKKVDLSNSGTIFSIKKLGDYRIKVYKQGYTFDCNTSGNPIDITMGASASVTCTHTP